MHASSFESDEEALRLVPQLEEQEVLGRRFRRRVLLAGASLAAAALLGCATSFARRAVVRRPGQVEQRAVTLASEGKCHTAEQGEPCYVDVRWAMTIGIKDHSDWYEGPCPSLASTSDFEEFQACVYKINMTSCPLPCNPRSVVSQDAVDQTHRNAPKHSAEARTDPCHIAQKGETCYDEVRASMANGPGKLRGHPTNFEEYQAALHEQAAGSSCPRPCACRTAVAGDECYEHVRWALDVGIQGHPSWYSGLDTDSTFEDVQKYLKHHDVGSCGLPCHPPGSGDVVIPEEVSCDEASWPDKDHDLVCGACQVLVDRFSSHYKTCEGYCTAVGRQCAGAWEEDGDTCKVLRPMTCDESIPSSDALCKCGRPLPDAKEVDELSTGPLDAPGADAQVDQQLKAALAGRRDGKEHHPGCHTAQEGERCYEDVLFGMTKGIHEHPDWYPDLNASSTFESFQMRLHKHPEMHCPAPCGCSTANVGEECYKNIQWVLREGIPNHPTWYPGLTVRSRFEEVQSRLFEDKNTTCPRPCAARPRPKPSLFCFSVFRSHGYELELIQAQLERKAGIFACDDFLVLSDRRLRVAGGVETLIIPPNDKVGVSKDGTAANTLIFMQAWSVVYNNVRYRSLDWVIKADPDAVVLVDRLRVHLAPHTGKNVFIKNCMKYEGPGWPMMFGSLEAFTHEAMETYFEGAEKCKRDLQWQAWGEDLFMGNCLSMLGASSDFDAGLIGDNVCKGANCGDGTTAAYHPFKSKDAWFKCYDQAMR